MTGEHSYDVVVLGTGAAGLVAALAALESGASVGLFEKTDLVGGTTAVSGGIVWLPANPAQPEAGVVDSPEAGVEYLMALSHDLIDLELAETFVRTGPEMVQFVQRTAPVRFRVVAGYPDYQPEHPGGLAGGGRSLECDLFPFERLGDWAARVRPKPRNPHLLLRETTLGGADDVVDPAVLADRAVSDERGTGQALVGGLLRALLDRGVEPVTGARATRLLREGDRVSGVEIDVDGVPTAVRAGAVVLATGGFEWDPDLVRAFLRGPMTAPASPRANTGDGLRMAMRVGAALGTMREAWWVPIWELPGPDGPERMLNLRERTLPRSIMVNRRGRRFVNEAANYNALGGAFHQFDATTFDYPNLPAWMVVDHEYLRRYGLGPVPPTDDAPDWLASGDTLTELADRIGIDAVGLEATVAAFNDAVDKRADDDFGRGASAYDGWSGDRSEEGAARTLGRLDTGPYHAVQVHSGALGTKGGPRTDADGRVLDVDGATVPGLFAAGNVMAGTTGMTYGGAGGTLGPALVFGYRAGRAAAAC